MVQSVAWLKQMEQQEGQLIKLEDRLRRMGLLGSSTVFSNRIPTFRDFFGGCYLLSGWSLFLVDWRVWLFWARGKSCNNEGGLRRTG